LAIPGIAVLRSVNQDAVYSTGDAVLYDKQIHTHACDKRALKMCPSYSAFPDSVTLLWTPGSLEKGTLIAFARIQNRG
jgi:hypothetical protein